MRNHAEKLKDMSESVLPSTERERARKTRRAIHQAHRSQERARLHAVRLDPEDAEVGPALERRRRVETDWMVGTRRGADKLGSLQRWARARIDADPVLAQASIDEQVAAFRTLLPDNTIGRHALQHIRFDLERRAGVGRYARPPQRLTGERLVESARARLAHQVRLILADGRHGQLNDQIRALLRSQDPQDPGYAYRTDARRGHRCPRRFLLDAADVDAFVADIHHDPCLTAVITRVAAG
jgi:hypothetical protein